MVRFLVALDFFFSSGTARSRGNEQEGGGCKSFLDVGALRACVSEILRVLESICTGYTKTEEERKPELRKQRESFQTSAQKGLLCRLPFILESVL